MIATSLSLRSPLPTRPMTSTRSSSPLLMAVLFNETSSAGGLSLRGHFYRVFKGTLSKSFNMTALFMTALFMDYVTEFLEVRWSPVILILVSIGVLFYGIFDFSHAISSTKWPKAPGRILTSQMVQPRSRYHPSISYAYVVGNTTYTGNTYRWGDTFYWKRETAEAAVQTYAPGSTVFISFG